jgi:nucleotide-binding universal stress UspA family protein
MEARQENGKFSRILAAIDGSSSSMKAVEIAIMMAEKGETGMSEINRTK